MHDKIPPDFLTWISNAATDWFVNAFFTVLAAIGGFLGHISRQLSKGEPVKFLHATVEAASSAFAGFVALLICKALGLDLYWSGAIVGIIGWIGASAGVALLERVVLSRLGVDMKPK